MNYINDEWFNILINTKTNRLKYVCMTDKNTLRICSNNNFWYEKFNHDQLPIINPGHTINQWISEYDRVFEAITIAEKLILLLKSERHNILSAKNHINFKLPFENTYRHFITPLIEDDFMDFKENIDQIELSFVLNDTNVNLAFLPIESGGYGFESHDTLSYNDLKNIFFKIFYYYPDVDPFDDDHLPYIDGPAMHQIFTTRQFYMLRSTKQALLHDRLDFWKLT